jgi:hypothetical protein
VGTALLWLVLGTAFAQRVEGDVVVGARGLYEAEISVNGQGEAERNTGFARALSQVLGKLTGNRSAASHPGVGQELRHVAGDEQRTPVTRWIKQQEREQAASRRPEYAYSLGRNQDREADAHRENVNRKVDGPSLQGT